MSTMTSSAKRDDFFIGWLPMPQNYAQFLRPVAILLFGAAVAGGAGLSVLQPDPGPGRWDSDNVATFDGLVFARPYAMLLTVGDKAGDPPRTILLVEEGKFGALPRVMPLVQGRTGGVAVRARGTMLHRDGRQMLELAEGDDGLRPLTSAEAAKLPALHWQPTATESVHLVGEIIDPKCYLGAMKPGGGKTHKACAMLCISGGIPPMLVTRDADKHETFYLLTTSDGGPANDMVLPFAGDAVAVTGFVERIGDLDVVKLNFDGIRRR
jgi:hypothetical protein